jgi:hypothetical protein
MHVIFFLNTTLYTTPNKLGIISNGSTNLEICNLQNDIKYVKIIPEKQK